MWWGRSFLWKGPAESNKVVDSIDFHKIDRVVRNILSVPGGGEEIDWTLDVAVEVQVGEVRDQPDSAIRFSNEEARAAPIRDAWYTM